MTKRFEIYKCEVCGNVVQVLLDSFGELVCCNQPMKKLQVQYDTNELGEKHAPKIEHRDEKKICKRKHSSNDSGTLHTIYRRYRFKKQRIASQIFLSGRKTRI